MRTLRAFVWLRWRLVLNSVRGGRRRDRFEQFSRAMSLVMPLALLALAFGSLVGITIVGFFGGRAVATGLLPAPTALLIARAMLFGLTIVLIIFSVTSPVQGSFTHYSRLLLLPVSRRALHGIEVMAGLTDPWIAFLAPGLLLFAVGLSVGGMTVAAIWAALAAVAFLAFLAALSACVGFLVAWLLRDRRRSEWFTLAFVAAMSAIGFVPIVLTEGSAAERREARRSGAPRPAFSIADFDRSLPAWSVAVPSELYGRAVRSGLNGDDAGAGVAVAGLTAEAAFFFAVSAVVHGRLIGSTTVSSRRRQGALARIGIRKLPGLSPAASAVAMAQARTAFRSVRGRLVVFMSGPLLAGLVFLLGRFGSEVTFFTRLGEYGFVLAAVATLMAILSAQAFTMNLFGSDRAGLTLQFLSPIGDADLARGKIAGIGVLILGAAALALVSALVVAPGGSPALWLAALAGAGSVYLILSPAAVWLSALFPVASDLSKTGSGGNPHGLAGFASLVIIAGAGAMSSGLFWAITWGAGRPDLTLPVMLAWLAVVAAVAWPLVALASRTVGLRRENLAMVAQGK